ncbi:glycosyltransferase family 4 protein [Chitinophaga barathri]|uniref:Undecaprenyl/decaprenyl-phosphate alpha-N-acetylglucosaminyl 1-phosphate transferase n=1 Tax=Chitinophaga barathri TaxID=1647451 RepID=A0A3N4M9U7_9BACT|nr:MraY family glycosyltransferase [Chitinophaga barathri]RPD40115.1 undecaprenyl/decaprenyl-phosphate alpha-N-acetylglucosaminyl 1-phosphate transferase [Chitinophaga barathri]
MENVIIATVLSFVITYFAIPVLIRVAELKHLYDEPDERKSHKIRIPTLGGLGFFAGFVLATAVCAPAQQAFPLQYLLAAFFIIFIVGMKDDIVGLSPVKKLVGQLVAAFTIIYLGNLQIQNMYGAFGIGELPYHFSLLLTYFTFIVVVNAFNLIDGIDGLAGSVGLLVSAVLGAYFLYVNEVLYAVMGFSLAAGLAAFLIYNITPAKIFMGDTGSLLVGLVNATMIVKFIEVAGNPAGTLPLQSVPAIAFAILIIPLFDTLRVFAIRMSRGRSPFTADRHHIHHYMLALGLSHGQATLIAVLSNIGFIVMACSLRDIGTTNLLLLTGGLAFGATTVLFYLKKRKEMPKPVMVPATEALDNRPSITKPKILRVNTESVLQDK